MFLFLGVRVVPSIGDTRKYSPQMNVTLFHGNRFSQVNRSFSDNLDLLIDLIVQFGDPIRNAGITEIQKIIQKNTEIQKSYTQTYYMSGVY